MKYGEKTKELYGSEKETTNNRMGADRRYLKALYAITPKGSGKWRVLLTTDSTYVRDGITKWLSKWKSNNWKTSNKKDVKNVDLWKELDEAIKLHDVRFAWVKGHNGHLVMNARTD